MSILNPIIKRLIGAGLPFGPNVLLTVRGRTSGVPRTFPVAILESGGRRFIQSPFGEVNWVRNLRASGAAIVSRGAQREEVDAIELDPEDAAPVLRDAFAPYIRSRMTRGVIRRSFHVGKDSTLEEYLAIARQHPTFELRPRETAPGD